MARTKPRVIEEFPVKGYIIRDVCYADDAVYVVCFKDHPVKYRQRDTSKRYGGIKYMRSVFQEPGHAINLAKRLNDASQTLDYTVWVYSSTGRRKIDIEYEFL